jgi:hydrogenase maturation protease
MKILIYGIGNPYRRDDRIGLDIAAQLATKVKKKNITVRSGSIDGLAMLDEIMGFDRVIFIDSIKTGNANPGDIHIIPVKQLEQKQSLVSSHGIDFVTAVRLGRRFGYRMPDKIVVYAIEIENNESYDETCTEKVKGSIPKVIEQITRDIHND